MKDAEDEAFDDLAKRQGDWGSGFQAKRAMAADKNNRKRGSIALARQLCYEIAGATNGDDDFSGSDYGSVDVAEILSAEIVRLREVLVQPAQEPPSEWASIKAILDEYGLQAIDFVADFKAALAQPTQPTEDVTYAIALQRAIESHCKGEIVPESVSVLCPHHAAKLNAALPAQEPVAFLDWYENAIWGNEDFQDGCHKAWDAAFEHAAPPKRKWVGLTDEEIEDIGLTSATSSDVRYILEAIKEKNNG